MPEEDYMVDLSDKIRQIRELVDGRCYFTINRARQYGKTTLLAALERSFREDYTVASISFEGLGDESFASAKELCSCFIKLVSEALSFRTADGDYAKKWQNTNVTTFEQLSTHITNMCKDRKVVLMVDEVDKASNNKVFLHFLSTLRHKFIARKSGKDYSFHSVILAGVYDIKNIKLKLIQEGSYTPTGGEGKIYNSPWNIAVSFDVDMSFHPTEIASMLVEYEGDHLTGMDISAVSNEIHRYTSGYPFLVSRICQCIDKELSGDWTAGGVTKAVQIIVNKTNTLFDDAIKNLENNAELSDLIYDILILGEERPYVEYDPTVGIGLRFGFLKKAENGEGVVMANKVFESVMTNYFVSKDLHRKKKSAGVLQQDLLIGGRFDMERCLRKFAEHYNEIYNDFDAWFLERHGRLLFLSYLKPLINGQGFYHIESQFTNLRRIDLVVDFGRQQFIVELKIWRGAQYQAEAYEQLAEYLDYKNAEEGYLLTFDFRKRKKGNKEQTAKWLDTYGKRIFEVIV